MLEGSRMLFLYPQTRILGLGELSLSPRELDMLCVSRLRVSLGAC